MVRPRKTRFKRDFILIRTITPMLNAASPRASSAPSARRGCCGFTLIELMVVMVLIALLLSIATPRYFNALSHGRIKVQRQNLAVMRDAIDKFYGDQGRYPDTLEDLVSLHYLREIPVDPVSESVDWVTLPPKDAAPGMIFDVQPAVPAASAAAGAGA